MAKQEFSIPSLMAQVPTEADAYELSESLRWEDGVVCPHCASVAAHHFLNPANGSSGNTRTGSISQRRAWKCKDCRKQFSLLTGTIFHGSKIPVRTWLFVIFEMCASENGVAARESEGKDDLAPKTTCLMLHRIREAMKREPLAGLLSGTTVADDTWNGCKPGNKHGGGYGKPRRMSEKQPVMSLVHKQSGEVRSAVVPNVTAKTLGPILRQNVDLPSSSSILHTDSSNSYRTVGKEFASHGSVSHFD